MTLHVLHAGDGYSYLTRQVATADRQRERGQDLADYYTENGTPPGRWAGSGLEALSKVSEVSGEVSEAQMKALYGEGRHPNADAMLADGEPLTATALGRKFPEFKNDVPLVKAYERALDTATEEQGSRPDAAARSVLWRGLADEHYRAEFGTAATSERELMSWAERQRRNVRQPVAGFDMVCTPQKSVSVLWALADNDTRTRIERIHHESVGDALGWLEREAAFSRRGDRSEQQIDTSGLIVAQFDHYDTRAGDPNLHTHNAVSNKVFCTADKKWRSLDGAALHRHTVAASQRYNATLVDRMRRELGVEFEARYPTAGKQAVWEVKGIDEGLCRAFSSRRAAIESRRDELVAEYHRTHGRAPSQAVHYDLLQQATLATRHGKDEPRSLADNRAGWRRIAATWLGSEHAVDQMVDRSLHPEKTPAGRELDAPEVEARRAVSTVSDTRAQWTPAHVRSVVEAQLTDVAFGSPEDRQGAVDTVVAEALSRHCESIATPAFADTPIAMRRESDGMSVLERHGEQLHTSAEILTAEQRVLDAARTPVAEFTTSEQFTAALAAQQERTGRELNPGQRALAEHFCLSGALVAAGVGPAGTGKTTSMAAVARAWESRGAKVVALAPSASAADGLGAELDVRGYTLAALTYPWRGRTGERPRDLDALPVELHRGDMLLVDEAAMASTKDLAALTDLALRSGAVVRLVGDPAQLDAVESGGLMRLVADETNAPELDQVVRFGDDTVQAASSLEVRAGHTCGLELHHDRGWVHDGTREAMLADAVADHLADTDAGIDGVILASDRATVAELNTRIQLAGRKAGRVKSGRQADLADGLAAARGDVVVTRTNRRDMRTVGGTRPGTRVTNGDRWRVEKVHRDGSMTVRHTQHAGRAHLDHRYVRASTELGYASTVHRAQGLTCDRSRTLVDASTNRRGLYVAVTRGRHENHLYAVTDAPMDVDTEAVHLAPGAENDVTDSRTLLAAALARDEGHTTATESLRDALAAADDPDRIAVHYGVARDLLIADYTDRLLTDLSPTDVDPADRSALHTAIDDALAGGVDVDDALRHWRDEVPDPDEPVASATGWLAGYDRQPTGDQLAPLPSRVAGTDPELDDHAVAAIAEHRSLVAAAELANTTAPDDDRSLHEAARDRVTSRKVTALTDTQLTARRARYEHQARLATTGIDRARAAEHAAADSPTTREVNRRHASLDAHAHAIAQARGLDQQIDYAHSQRIKASRQLDAAARHRDELGPLAIRRRGEAERAVAEAKHKVEHWEHAFTAADRARLDLQPHPGDPSTWGDVERRATDTNARQTERDRATAADQASLDAARADIDEHTSALDKAKRNIHTIDREATRRSTLTPAELHAENAVRTDLAGPTPEPTAHSRAPRRGTTRDMLHRTHDLDQTPHTDTGLGL